MQGYIFWKQKNFSKAHLLNLLIKGRCNSKTLNFKLQSNLQTDFLIRFISKKKPQLINSRDSLMFQVQREIFHYKVNKQNFTQTPVTSLWILPGRGTARYTGKWIISLRAKKKSLHSEQQMRKVREILPSGKTWWKQNNMPFQIIVSFPTKLFIQQHGITVWRKELIQDTYGQHRFFAPWSICNFISM